MARKVARNALFSTSALVAGSLSGLFLAIIIARILTPEYYGVYSLTLAITNIAIAITNLGIDGAVTRYTACFAEDIYKVRSHFRYFLKIKTLLAFSVSIIFFLTSERLATFFGDDRLAIPFAIASLIVLFASFTNVLNAFFMGFQEFKYTFLKQIVYEGSRWAFVLPLSLIFLASGAVFGTALSYFIAFLFLMVVTAKCYKDYVTGPTGKVSEGVNAFMGFMTIASVSGIIYAYVDSIMIGYLLTPTDVGYYRAAYTIIFAVIGLVSSLSHVLLPTFTQLNIEDISKSLERLIRYSSIIAFPSAILISHLSEEIVRVVYGVDYLEAYPAMVFLSFALIPGTFNYLTTIFNAKERADISASLITSSMVLNVALNYFLITYMGIAGAAIATVISRFFVATFAVALLYRLFGISFKLSSVLKPLISSLVMLAVLIDLPEPQSLALRIAEVAFAGVIYFAILFGIKGISMEDVRYFKNLI